MREIDRATSERFGVPSITLMENAGSAVADFVLATYPWAARIGVICGKGNNGGDGFVVARKLHNSEKEVALLLLSDPRELSGDAAEMFLRVGMKPVVAQSSEDLRTPVRRLFRTGRADRCNSRDRLSSPGQWPVRRCDCRAECMF